MFKFTMKINDGEKKMKFITDGNYLLSKASYLLYKKNGGKKSFTGYFKSLVNGDAILYNYKELCIDGFKYNSIKEMTSNSLRYISYDDVAINIDDVYNILGKVLTKTMGLPYNKVANRRRFVRNNY